MKARIIEVFDTVQGEGIYFGEKQIFVRFFGCNLSCRFCDTPSNRFTEYEPQELFNEINLYKNDFHSISFTGGEPLLQKDFLKEILKLSSAGGYRNYLETNGTLAGELKEVIDYLDIIAMDLKLPSSIGMASHLWGMHRKFLEVASKKEVFIKVVICHSTKEKDLREALKLIKEVNHSAILVLQPNSHEDDAWLRVRIGVFADMAQEENITACVIPQMHKAIGLE
ncbi:MAG: hypothetical protein A2984_00910 [Omnitrophica WOR_2 bacterium RIFCSPLOWO2_01_FULL_41_12]|nr:MAG: hypothetical protein A2984_00910 [Omnitrophica WOR_2 bacterium RIFCSPLOWO2_01_FULL_41_12]